MIVFVLPATGAPDPMVSVDGAQLDGKAAGFHAHGHDHEFDAEASACTVGPDTTHVHGHDQADHSHEATGLIPSLSTSLAITHRSWHPQHPWVSISHAPFLLERPPRPIVV